MGHGDRLRLALVGDLHLSLRLRGLLGFQNQICPLYTDGPDELSNSRIYEIILYLYPFLLFFLLFILFVEIMLLRCRESMFRFLLLFSSCKIFFFLLSFCVSMLFFPIH